MGDFDDLKQKIDYYLQNDLERERIRLNGFEKVSNYCTYEYRMKEMLARLAGLEPQLRKRI